jgi:hypothetical protein
MKGYRITRHDGLCGIVSDRLTFKGWTVAQEPRLVNVDGNTLRHLLQVVSAVFPALAKVTLLGYVSLRNFSPVMKSPSSK